MISAYKHILEGGKGVFSADELKRITDNFEGYDISPDMVRLSLVNMYLHNFVKPKISEYDTLSTLDKWDDAFDVILANPPFMSPKGGITPHNRFRIRANRSEVLFVDYIAEHLSATGKAAVIVPEGIVFQTGRAYKELRKFLIEDGLLYGVISLPGGVFNPYSGVKTSVLLIDKRLARVRKEILFIKITADGFGLGAQRREIKENDIPDVIEIVKEFQRSDDYAEISKSPLVTIAEKTKLAEQDYILVGERYKETIASGSDWPMVELGEVCEIYNGSTPSRSDPSYWDKGNIPWFTIEDIRTQGREINFTSQYVTKKAVNETSIKILPVN